MWKHKGRICMHVQCNIGNATCIGASTHAWLHMWAYGAKNTLWFGKSPSFTLVYWHRNPVGNFPQKTMQDCTSGAVRWPCTLPCMAVNVLSSANMTFNDYLQAWTRPKSVFSWWDTCKLQQVSSHVDSQLPMWAKQEKSHVDSQLPMWVCFIKNIPHRQNRRNPV